jgi:hypothetical protein
MKRTESKSKAAFPKLMQWGSLLVHIAVIVLLICSFVSCAGVSADIAVRKDGSFLVTLDYSISEELDSLGKLDGNARWLPVPVGKADFERSAARINGMRLVSFKSKREKGVIHNKAGLRFSSPESLLAFLDASGRGASFSRENGQNRLFLLLADGEAHFENELAELVTEACNGYFFELNLNFPGTGEAFLYSANGSPVTELPPQWKLAGGRKSVFSAPMGDLLLSSKPVSVEFRWTL